MQQYLEIALLFLFFAFYCYTNVKQIRLLRSIENQLDSIKIKSHDEEKDIQTDLNNRLLRLQQENYARRYPRLR